MRFRFSSQHASCMRHASLRQAKAGILTLEKRQVFKTSFFSHQDDHTIPATDTPELKTFTVLFYFLIKVMRRYFLISFKKYWVWLYLYSRMENQGVRSGLLENRHVMLFRGSSHKLDANRKILR